VSDRWIQKAIKRPGSLKAWLKRKRGDITRKLGESPFTRRGTIKMSVLRKLKKNKELLKELAGPQWRRIHRKINLAVTLRQLRR